MQPPTTPLKSGALPYFVLFFLVLLFETGAYAQGVSLSLASGAATPGSTVDLDITATTGIPPPAALQWVVNYSATDVSSIDLTVGPAATNASKSLVCNPTPGSIICIVYGLNANPIANGVVATVHVTLSASISTATTPIFLTSRIASDPAGNAIPATSVSGSITVLGINGFPGGGLRFVPVTPCRIVETRPEYNIPTRTGSLGPPFMGGNEIRTMIPLQSNVCQIPVNAKAYALNVTLVPRGSVNFVTIWPTGEPQPTYWTIRSPDGNTVANSALVKAGINTGINVYASDATDLVIDIAGYFTDNPAVASLAYYPLTSCRVVDTRIDYRTPGPFGPPSMAASETRHFRFPSTPYCQIPTGATAYSATLTVVPQGPLQFLTTGPTGSPQPNVSSINSPSGRILANSVIIPAYQDSIDVFTSNQTDLIIDINGYFAPDDGRTGLYYFPVPQCRAVDTTNPLYPGVFGGPLFGDNATRSIAIPSSAFCSGVPSTAKAYAMSITATPVGPLPFITVFPTGQPQPTSSILSAFEGQVITNSAIVPAGPNGSIDFYTFRQTNLAVEISGYFDR